MKKKFLTAAALLLALASVFCSCKGPGKDPADSTAPGSDSVPEESTAAPGTGDLILMQDGKAVYTVIRGDTVSETQIAAAVFFNTTLRDRIGKTLPISDDYIFPTKPYDPTWKEVLIGSTNREESAALEARLEKGQFAISIGENKIVIVAQRDSLLKMAVTYFYENMVTTCSDGTLCTVRDTEYFSEPGMKSNDNIYTISKNLTADVEEVLNIKVPVAGAKTPQGGYCDGQYYYQIFIDRDYENNETDNKDYIVKADMKTGKVVKTSGALAMNHANDIAYNPKTNKLYVVHNNPNRTYVSVVDPDTLEITDRVELPLRIYCMDYNEKHNLYVVGVAGGQSFRFLDENFKEVGNIHSPTNSTNGYTTQGMSCDDDFIYFVLYKENVITVYDWDGKFMSVVHFDVGSIEPENISSVGGDLYVGCAKSGTTVFLVTPKEAE